MLSELEKKAAGLIQSNPPVSRYPDYNFPRPNYTDLMFNMNSIPYKTDTAIIVTAWLEQLPYMKATLTNYRLTDKFIICAYDPPFSPWDKIGSLDKLLPSRDIWLLPHTWVFKHITYDNSKRNGWFWSVKYAQGIVRQFANIKYIFHVNADCIWEKPEGVDDLIKLITNGDFMAISRERETIHTCAILYRAEVFHAVFDKMVERYSTPVMGSWSPEKTLYETIQQVGAKEIVAPKQPQEPDGSGVDHYTRFNQESTWKDIVGYRNLAAEMGTCLIDAKEPINIEYFDTRYSYLLCTSNILMKYYETRDRRWLYKLWDSNEDSWYNRVNYPIEYYGEKPILEKENG
jgi:hypothetical protein